MKNIIIQYIQFYENNESHISYISSPLDQFGTYILNKKIENAFVFNPKSFYILNHYVKNCIFNSGEYYWEGSKRIHEIFKVINQIETERPISEWHSETIKCLNSDWKLKEQTAEKSGK